MAGAHYSETFHLLYAVQAFQERKAEAKTCLIQGQVQPRDKLRLMGSPKEVSVSPRGMADHSQGHTILRCHSISQESQHMVLSLSRHV